jgi:hypothetical protein
MSIDLRSLTGGISIGLDRSGAFAISASGLAVRDSNGRYKARTDTDQFVDVTEVSWSLDDPQSWVLRLPVPVDEVRAGDLIVVEEHPVRVILVHEVVAEPPAGGRLSGITADGEFIEYRPASSFFFGRPMVVKVISLFELFDDARGGDSTLPLLALTVGRGGGDGGAGTALVLASALRRGPGDRPDAQHLLLLALLACRDRSDGWLDVLLLSLAFRHRLPLAPGAPGEQGPVRPRGRRRRTK